MAPPSGPWHWTPEHLPHRPFFFLSTPTAILIIINWLVGKTKNKKTKKRHVTSASDVSESKELMNCKKINGVGGRRRRQFISRAETTTTMTTTTAVGGPENNHGRYQRIFAVPWRNLNAFCVSARPCVSASAFLSVRRL